MIYGEGALISEKGHMNSGDVAIDLYEREPINFGEGTYEFRRRDL